jgi:ATP-dependent protease HslVU (ClpYQ) ATPase subunit
MQDLTPRQIVEELDRYIIGQAGGRDRAAEPVPAEPDVGRPAG